MRAIQWFCVVCTAWALGCSGSKDQQAEKQDPSAERRTRPLGVDPTLFKCEMVAPMAELESLLGGTITTVETAFQPPEGTPAPCNYVRAEGEKQEPWSFDMDCRADALKTADTLISQYQAGAASQDAGAAEVQVGRRALDHHGQALIFVDDDTPCYVRVRGPKAEGRLALARLIAQGLTYDTAPTRASFRQKVQ